MDASSLVFLVGILACTSIYRQRGRLDDNLYFAMTLTVIALAASDAAAYLLEGRGLPGAREVMIAGNIVFYTAFEVFAYLFVLYLDFRIHRSEERVRARKLPYLIPCLLLLAVLLINLKTGWIFSVDEGQIYHSGPYNNVVFVPAAIYFLIAIGKIRQMDRRLIVLCLLAVAVRIAMGVWFRQISSTAFTYTLFLACAHIHVMNQPLTEDKTWA